MVVALEGAVDAVVLARVELGVACILLGLGVRSLLDAGQAHVPHRHRGTPLAVGFAHGLCTLEPGSEVQYKVSGYYDPACDKGLAWNDPEIGIDWPIGNASPILSQKDERQPLLRDLPPYFTYQASPQLKEPT